LSQAKSDEIVERLEQGQTISEISAALNVKKRSVHRRAERIEQTGQYYQESRTPKTRKLNEEKNKENIDPRAAQISPYKVLKTSSDERGQIKYGCIQRDSVRTIAEVVGRSKSTTHRWISRYHKTSDVLVMPRSRHPKVTSPYDHPSIVRSALK